MPTATIPQPSPAWTFSDLAPPPAWREEGTLHALFARFTPAQDWAMARLLAQDGKGCDIPLNTLYALGRLGMLVPVVETPRGGWRVCGHLWCGRYWYHMPSDVVQAYTTWCAGWEDA